MKIKKFLKDLFFKDAEEELRLLTNNYLNEAYIIESDVNQKEILSAYETNLYLNKIEAMTDMLQKRKNLVNNQGLHIRLVNVFAFELIGIFTFLLYNVLTLPIILVLLTSIFIHFSLFMSTYKISDKYNKVLLDISSLTKVFNKLLDQIHDKSIIFKFELNEEEKEYDKEYEIELVASKLINDFLNGKPINLSNEIINRKIGEILVSDLKMPNISLIELLIIAKTQSDEQLIKSAYELELSKKSLHF